MSTIIASHVPNSVTIDKLKDFFSFCGKVVSITPQADPSQVSKSYEIHFESSKALSTALLLNDAELDGVPIEVVEKDAKTSTASGSGSGEREAVPPPAYSDSDTKPDLLGDNKVQTTKTGDNNYDDISQEEKPKYAIMAQLLANGYIVSDKVITHAIDLDKKNGYSTKFSNFLTNLDEKYIHSQVPGTTVNKNLASAQDTLTNLQNQFNTKYSKTLSYYYEKAANHPYGVKVHDFYKSFAKDVQDVHKEATRLVELKKASESTDATPEVAAEAADKPAPAAPAAPSASK